MIAIIITIIITLCIDFVIVVFCLDNNSSVINNIANNIHEEKMCRIRNNELENEDFEYDDMHI